MKRRDFSKNLLLGTLTVGGLPQALSSAWAQNAPSEGVHYRRIEPAQPTIAAGKVEVLEFFSYACPHCFEFEHLLAPWAARLPADVVFRRVPVSFLPNAENFQRAYYALESLGWLDKVHPRIFSAVHVDKKRLSKPEELAEVVSKAGADGGKFLESFNSFAVVSKAQQGKRTIEGYRIEGVPALAVGGRFSTSPSQANGSAQALAVAEYLIQKVQGKARG
jgi:thiol:disulfide interchange protein DsbA